MTDEIKEILDRLDYEEWEDDLYKTLITWCELYNIRDYITNLQQENERLKECYCNRTDCTGRIKDSKKYDSVYQEKEDYKSRCEKAIEFIKSTYFYGMRSGRTLIQKYLNNLLNILNGSDNNE